MEIKDELTQLAEGKIEEAQPAEGINMTQWVFANEQNPGLVQLFHSLYQGVFSNKLGLAHCKNVKTGNLDTLIVGVNPTEEGSVQLFPLAVVIEEADVMNWHSPDGAGGYVGPAE